MPGPHRPPDKTRRSRLCRVRRCQLSRPDKYVLRRSASSGRTAPADTLRHRPDTERTCLTVGPTQFTPPHRTRQNSPVCVVSGVNWAIAINVIRLQIFCRRNVGNPIHTAEVDATQTRQFCRVWRCSVNYLHELRTHLVQRGYSVRQLQLGSVQFICCEQVLRLHYRAMLCIRGTSHGPVSVCLSVCLSHVGVLIKRLNVGSDKQHHTIARNSSFLKPKISAKFDRGHPIRGRQMQVGWITTKFDRGHPLRGRQMQVG